MHCCCVVNRLFLLSCLLLPLLSFTFSLTSKASHMYTPTHTFPQTNATKKSKLYRQLQWTAQSAPCAAITRQQRFGQISSAATMKTTFSRTPTYSWLSSPSSPTTQRQETPSLQGQGVPSYRVGTTC